MVCGGGTGSFLYDAAGAVFSEIHAGSFALMDVNYARNEVDPAGPAFEFAMFVLSCVMSVGAERATARCRPEGIFDRRGAAPADLRRVAGAQRDGRAHGADARRRRGADQAGRQGAADSEPV